MSNPRYDQSIIDARRREMRVINAGLDEMYRRNAVANKVLSRYVHHGAEGWVETIERLALELAKQNAELTDRLSDSQWPSAF